LAGADPSQFLKNSAADADASVLFGPNSKRLEALLRNNGGIEGAAHQRAKLRIMERSRAPTEDAADG
jgi:hypothetical protein